jgi:hypothetical protein
MEAHTLGIAVRQQMCAGVPANATLCHSYHRGIYFYTVSSSEAQILCPFGL